MGVKRLKLKVSPSRLFKALITESQDVLPMVNPIIHSIEIVEGHAVAPGCVYHINFLEGAPFKYLKTRIDSIDSVNYVCKFSTVEGEILSDKYEKISHVLKIEASGDGGSVVKLTSEYHSMGGYEPSDEENNVVTEQAVGLYKACEEFLLANPHVCA